GLRIGRPEIAAVRSRNGRNEQQAAKHPKSHFADSLQRSRHKSSIHQRSSLLEHQRKQTTNCPGVQATVLIIIVQQASRNKSNQKLSLDGTSVIESGRYV